MAGMTLLPSVQTTKTKTAPWSVAQPALKTALGGAMDAYNNTYNGPLVAGMDPNVTAGQNAQLGLAGQGQMTGAAQQGISGLNSILANGGIGAPMQQGMDYMNQAAGYLNPYASGSMVGNNPYLNDMIRANQMATENQVNANFSKAGRYGSGAYAGALGSALGNIDANLRYQDLQNQQGNQLSAINHLAGIGSGVAGIGQQGISNIMNGGAALSNYQNPLYSDANQQKAVGGERMDYQQALIDAKNQAPWTKLGNLSQIAQGIGGMGGTTNSTSIGLQGVQKPQGPSTGQMIGGAALGALGAGANIANAGGFKGLFSGLF